MAEELYIGFSISSCYLTTWQIIKNKSPAPISGGTFQIWSTIQTRHVNKKYVFALFDSVGYEFSNYSCTENFIDDVESLNFVSDSYWFIE